MPDAQPFAQHFQVRIVDVGSELICGQPAGDEKGVNPLAGRASDIGSDSVTDRKDTAVIRPADRRQTAARKVIDRRVRLAKVKRGAADGPDRQRYRDWRTASAGPWSSPAGTAGDNPRGPR